MKFMFSCSVSTTKLMAEVLFLFVRSSSFYLLDKLFAIISFGGLRVWVGWGGGWVGVMEMGLMTTSDKAFLVPMFSLTFIS